MLACLPETPTSGACTPSDGCDVFAQNCPNGAACLFMGNGATTCWFATGAVHGQACVQGLCAAGFQCDYGSNTCRRVCQPGGAACPGGGSCADHTGFAGFSVGLCTP
jgi:hypothetical protein